MSEKDLYDKIEALAAVVADLQIQLSDITVSTVIKNKDGIPIGTEVDAEIDDKLVVLETERTGYRVKAVGDNKIVEGVKFSSLSAAAEALSGIKRKSGWVFWRDSKTGRTLKEQYKG